MDKTNGKLTVYFEEPFWVGVFERIEDGKLSVAKVIFGAEPKDYEVQEYIQQCYFSLKFSPAVETVVKDIKRNPKRMHREVKKQTNLLLYSELLMEETLPASAKENVEALYKQSEKLRFLIDSLVKLSRLENGIISLSPQQASLQPLLESVVEQYAAKASGKGLSIYLYDTDISATFDFKWTEEALANIVDNAIKYTEHGTITISTVNYEMFTRIDISDTGSGIPENEQAKIFSRFYRSNAVQEQEGVGIGLYLARQIISGESGYIKVASVPGKGSTFSIFLPK